MKIFSAAQIREIDAKTIEYEPVSSIDLMERAAQSFTDWFLENHVPTEWSVTLVCGTGNNGGDGLAVGRLLHGKNYKVCVYLMPGDTLSADCAENLRRARASGVDVRTIAAADNIPLSDTSVIVDAIFGSGLNRELSGLPAEVVRRINGSGKTVVSIDVPSGLFLDRKTSLAIQATDTVTFQIPKLALYLPVNHRFVGNVHIVNIGLNEKALSEAETRLFFTEKADVRPLLKPLSKFAHKGAQGHALIIGGSFGKIGSVCLASRAALKAGCGLVTAFLPGCGVPIIQSHFPEAMAVSDRNENHISDILFEVKPHAIAIGMGMGTDEDSQEAFRRFLSTNRVPLVIDADGLNILSKNKDWLDMLGPKTILTPHPKELSRLLGEWTDDFDKIDRVRKFARKYNVVLVVKGAYSLVLDAENLFVNSSGTPALATAGSGDVLSGIIAGLMAQGYEPIDAARIGVYLHGLTADISSKKIHPRSFVATDIIEHIGKAYFEIEK
ncbi:MAG: NAD(P)H-hydrate dehydratase [Dysgonamonadaceae bacterium]|jgi:hydroxyethylthiazole kinase-like uncharacterized protein yjeF|nr:NAD(P)H-hydrate dehydratase [Dysgonamonadaceae bacterium]